MIKVFRLAAFLFFGVNALMACTNENEIQIVTSDNPSVTEKLTAKDLKIDLEKVSDIQVAIVEESKSKTSSKKIIIGTSDSNRLIQKFLSDSENKLTSENPGARGGIWYKVDTQTIILAGSDIQGMQYAVYDYSREILKLDPLIYWSGHSTPDLQLSDIFKIENRTINPPKVPLLVYFENDVDELLNLKEPLLEYDWESYTEMIDALVRMRYNGIQLFDALGRAEFFLRPEYKNMVPDYSIDIEKIEKMIDYAHDKGMYVQVDLSLGYKIKALDSEYADCWAQYKNKWIEMWKYYLEKTPIGKSDIYSLRPRNQVWDWEYKSTCGESKIEVFNEVYQVLDSVIEAHNPEAEKVVICYHDGMDMFNEGFRPPRDWIVAWSDDGYADFKVYPTTTDGFEFGTYMHAGFWKNHTVNHPYPHQIDSIMHKMFDQYNATAYCQVNGQQFRPFIFNLEAFSEVCRDPAGFSADAFLDSWADRYFPNNLHKDIIQLMKDWDEASFGKAGYVQNLWEIKEAIAYLAELPIQSPGKDAKPYTAERVLSDIEAAIKRFELFERLLQLSAQILPKTDPNSAYYYDQIHFPIESYRDLLGLEVILHDMFAIKRAYEKVPNKQLKLEAKILLEKAQKQLADIYTNTEEEAKDPKWNDWYDVKKRRPNNGFPTQEMLAEMETAIDTKW